MNAPARDRGVAAAVVLGAPLLVLAGIAAWAGLERAEFAPRSVTDVESALTAGGLTVCARAATPDPLANQAVATRTLTVATDGARGDRADLVVDRFADADDRDAAVRAHEGQLRPRGSGAVYTWGELSILVRGGSDTAVADRAGDALRTAGAR